MIRRFIVFFIFILLSRLVYSQESDFGAWYEVNAEKSFSKKFDVSGTFMVRTFDNASKIDQLFFELGASYSLNKYLGFAASYRIGNYVEDDYLYHVRNKWFTDIKGTLPAGNFVFSARVRFQILARTYIEDPGDDKVEYEGRIKLKGVYKIPDFPVDPYLSFETFTPLFRNEGRFVDKSRTSVGLEFKLSKKHAIDAEYIYQRDNVPHLSIMHIISLGYTFKF